MVRCADPDDPEGTRWALPSGEVHDKEDSCDAAVRGAQESTGYLVEVDDLIGMDNRDEGLRIYYTVHIVSGESSDAAAWFDLDSLPALIRNPTVDAALARLRPLG